VSKKNGMNLLWAPWRIPYLRKIHKEKPGTCFFCDYVPAPKKDRKNLVVLRGRTCFTVMNRFPYAGGHLLVAPYAHKADLTQFTAEERQEVFDQLIRMQRVLEKLMKPQGFNLGLNIGRAAGAGVPGHLHFHLLPRWFGDSNFMASTAQVRVIPQALEELHGELQKALRNVR
jgi:ATP adenylyltransferase